MGLGDPVPEVVEVVRDGRCRVVRAAHSQDVACPVPARRASTRSAAGVASTSTPSTSTFPGLGRISPEVATATSTSDVPGSGASIGIAVTEPVDTAPRNPGPACGTHPLPGDVARLADQHSRSLRSFQPRPVATRLSGMRGANRQH